MKPVSDIRRQNLSALVAQEGSQVAVAAKLGKDKNQIYQWLLDPSTEGARNVGPRSARQIEQAFGKPDGWLDHEHTADELPASQSVGRDIGKLAQSVEMVRWAAEIRSKAGLQPFTPLKEAALLEAVYNLLMSPGPANLVELGAYLNTEATGDDGDGQGPPRGNQEDGVRRFG